MIDFFNSYKQAFDNFRASEIALHYKFPCLVSDMDGLQLYATKEQLTAKFLKNCQHMQSIGYTGSEFDIVENKTLGENILSVDIIWKVILDSGVHEFNTLYLCQKEDGKWLIFNAVVYE